MGVGYAKPKVVGEPVFVKGNVLSRSTRADLRNGTTLMVAILTSSARATTDRGDEEGQTTGVYVGCWFNLNSGLGKNNDWVNEFY